MLSNLSSAVQHERGPRNSTLQRQMALYFKDPVSVESSSHHNSQILDLTSTSRVSSTTSPSVTTMADDMANVRIPPAIPLLYSAQFLNRVNNRVFFSICLKFLIFKREIKTQFYSARILVHHFETSLIALSHTHTQSSSTLSG